MSAIREVTYSEYTEEDFIYSFLYANVYPEFRNKNFAFKKIKSEKEANTYLVVTGNQKYILVVSTLDMEYGKLRQEYNNTKNLNRKNKTLVLKPFHYYTDGLRELYVLDYPFKIKRISFEDGEIGICDSKKGYEFEHLSDQKKNMINCSIVYTLVKLYDEKRELAPSKIDIKAGDFILCDDFNFEMMNLSTTVDNMKLVKSREIKEMSFKHYINALRNDLIDRKYSSAKKDPIIFSEGQNAFMTMDQVETGITLGLKYKRNLQ